MPFEPTKKPDSKLAKYLLQHDNRQFDTNKDLITWSTKNSKKIDEKIKEMLLKNFEIKKIKEKLEKNNDNDSFNKSYYNFNKKDLDKRIEKVKKSINKAKPGKNQIEKSINKAKPVENRINKAKSSVRVIPVVKKKKSKSSKIYAGIKSANKMEKKRLDQKYKEQKCNHMLKEIRKEFLQIIDKHISEKKSSKTVSTLILKKSRQPAKKPSPSLTPIRRRRSSKKRSPINSPSDKSTPSHSPSPGNYYPTPEYKTPPYLSPSSPPLGPAKKRPPPTPSPSNYHPTPEGKSSPSPSPRKNVLIPPPPYSPFSTPESPGKSPLSDITMM